MTKINSNEPIKIQSEIFKNADKKTLDQKSTEQIRQVANSIDTKKDTREVHFMPKPIA